MATAVGWSGACGGQPTSQAAGKTPAVPCPSRTSGGCPVTPPGREAEGADDAKEESGVSQGDVSFSAPLLLPRQSPHAAEVDMDPGHETEERPPSPSAVARRSRHETPAEVAAPVSVPHQITNCS